MLLLSNRALKIVNKSILEMNELFPLLILLFIVGFFYSSVGHGGASGYIAVLSIFGLSATFIKPSALLINIFVAGIAFYQYYRMGYFRWFARGSEEDL